MVLLPDAANFDLRLCIGRKRRARKVVSCRLSVVSMTKESREGMKIVALMIAIALLWIVVISAVFWIGGKLDDGPAARPSQWRR